MISQWWLAMVAACAFANGTGPRDPATTPADSPADSAPADSDSGDSDPGDTDTAVTTPDPRG